MDKPSGIPIQKGPTVPLLKTPDYSEWNGDGDKKWICLDTREVKNAHPLPYQTGSIAALGGAVLFLTIR